MGKCLTNNLSKGGIFIQTKSEFNLGQIVFLKLVHPVTDEALEVQGEIVHIRKSLKAYDDIKSSDGIGIRFIDLNRQKEERITQFLKSLIIQKKKRKTAKKK